MENFYCWYLSDLNIMSKKWFSDFQLAWSTYFDFSNWIVNNRRPCNFKSDLTLFIYEARKMVSVCVCLFWHFDGRSHKNKCWHNSWWAMDSRKEKKHECKKQNRRVQLIALKTIHTVKSVKIVFCTNLYLLYIYLTF